MLANKRQTNLPAQARQHSAVTRGLRTSDFGLPRTFCGSPKSQCVALWTLALLLVAAACHTREPVSLAPLPHEAYAHYLAGELALYAGHDADAATALSQAAAARRTSR